MSSVNHLVAFEIQSLQQMRCVFFHSQSWIILAPNDLGREFSRLQSGLDTLLKSGGPFEAPHNLEERSSAIWPQEELGISSALCSVDVARAERFIENVKHRSSRGLYPKPPELAHIDERIEDRERLNSIGNAPDDIKTDRPPYVVNHQMKISYACRVDGFQIPGGEHAPAIIEIGRPIGKTQSRQIKSDPLKPAAGQFRQKLSIKKARSGNPINNNNGLSLAHPPQDRVRPFDRENTALLPPFFD